MKKFFFYCISMLMLGTVGAQAQIVTDEELDETFQFVDELGNVVANGSTIVVTEINKEGQMIVPLYVKNVAGEKVAVSMYEDLSQQPNGGWQTCAFGNCMNLEKSGYSAKSIVAEDYNADIQTEWIPVAGQYATWEAKLQIHIFNITTKMQFGTPVQQPGNEIIGYGPVVTVRFEYKDPDAQDEAITVNMGSYSSDKYSAQGSGLPAYVSGSTTVTLYQQLTAEDLAMFDGAVVKKLRVAFAQNQSKDTKIFIAPVTKQGYIGENLVEGQVTAPKAGWNTFELSTPYTIDASEYAALLLGFTYTQTNSNNGQYYNEECYPLSIMSSSPHGYTIYASGLNNSRYGLSANNIYNIGVGNVSIQAVVEGNFMKNAAQFFDFNSIVLRPGETRENGIIFHNMGVEAVKTLGFVVTADGVASEEQTVSVSDGPAFNEYGEIYIPFKASDKMGTEHRVYAITKVNGQPNGVAVDNSSAKGLVATTDRVVKKRVAVEEFTGTGCGWCPRGMVGMEKMRETFQDDFVGIAFHQYSDASRDAMYMPEYPNPGLDSAPGCMIDRQANVDPYYGSGEENFGVKDVFEMALKQQPKAGLEVKGTWTDENTVKATATVESLIGGENYGIEFSLIADGLTGTGNTWSQSNYYYQYTQAQVGSSDLAPFCSGGSYGKSSVSGLTFNDVAIATSYNADGVNQADALDNTPDDETVQAQYSLTLPTRTAFRNAIKSENVWVVALLIDTYDGSVVNAAKFRMPNFEESQGISGVTESNAVTTDRYAVDGRQLPEAKKGLNIVRMSDGTVRKVVVK